eukprot:TRINITY_DN2695_c2_g1_i1.p1 TRINITY_DN2695_c2_g1~~TRINITY_DN2695_c2_g1_i1.p1  ORF type:complete len:393 (+),score=122.50 TRINITY_DN2695_c2_g1_i1:102-1280(+)
MLKKKQQQQQVEEEQELISFPADTRFWKELVHQVRMYPGAQRGPHYHIDCDKLGQAMLINRAFLRRFVAGWEKRNPHIVSRQTTYGDQTWHSSQEFWGNSGRMWEEDVAPDQWQPQQQYGDQWQQQPPPPQQPPPMSPVDHLFVPPQPQQQWQQPPPQAPVVASGYAPHWSAAQQQPPPGPMPPPPMSVQGPPPQQPYQPHFGGVDYAAAAAGSTDRSLGRPPAAPRGFISTNSGSPPTGLSLEEKLRRAQAQLFDWQRERAADPRMWTQPQSAGPVGGAAAASGCAAPAAPAGAPAAAAGAPPHAAFLRSEPAGRSRGLPAPTGDPVYAPRAAPLPSVPAAPAPPLPAPQPCHALSAAFEERMRRLEQGIGRCQASLREGSHSPQPAGRLF